MRAFLFTTVVCAALLVPPIAAQITLPSGFSVVSTTSAATLGIPAELGGIEFSADGMTLYVGGDANASSGAVYAVTVQRDPTTLYVTGLGPATLFASAPNNDGGLQFEPASGTLLFSQYPINGLGQIAGGVTSSAPLPPEIDSTGGLTIVPPGLPNAGDLLVSSYNNGDIFTVGLTPGPGGTFTPTTATLYASLPNGTEGFRFIPSGANAGDLIMTNYSVGTVAIMDIDPNTGLPVNYNLATFASGIGGALGFAFDPLTNDFFVSTYNGSPSNSILQIGGFPAPPFPLVPSAPSISSATGGSVNLDLQAGALNANRGYIVLAGVSGTSPGLSYLFLNFPLNPDFFTDFVLMWSNTPLFNNFIGTLDVAGNATASINTPPIPPVAIGINMYFAAAVFPPFTAASNPVTVGIVP